MENLMIVGYKDVEFRGNDGNVVSGRKYYFTRSDPKVKGMEAGSFFLTASALSSVGYIPTVNDEVEAHYNRFGKIAAITEVQ